jgi:hypothetical protein
MIDLGLLTHGLSTSLSLSSFKHALSREVTIVSLHPLNYFFCVQTATLGFMLLSCHYFVALQKILQLLVVISGRDT